jgi:hypothetical protein
VAFFTHNRGITFLKEMDSSKCSSPRHLLIPVGQRLLDRSVSLQQLVRVRDDNRVWNDLRIETGLLHGIKCLPLAPGPKINAPGNVGRGGGTPQPGVAVNNKAAFRAGTATRRKPVNGSGLLSFSISVSGLTVANCGHDKTETQAA